MCVDERNTLLEHNTSEYERELGLLMIKNDGMSRSGSEYSTSNSR